MRLAVLLGLLHVPVITGTSALLFRMTGRSSDAAFIGVSIFVLVLVSFVVGMIFYVLVERPCMSPDWPSRLASFVRRRLNGSPESSGGATNPDSETK